MKKFAGVSLLIFSLFSVSAFASDMTLTGPKASQLIATYSSETGSHAVALGPVICSAIFIYDGNHTTLSSGCRDAAGITVFSAALSSELMTVFPDTAVVSGLYVKFDGVTCNNTDTCTFKNACGTNYSNWSVGDLKTCM